MFDAGRTGSPPLVSYTTAPSIATVTHVGAGRSAVNCWRPVRRSFVASWPVTMPGTRRADRRGVATWAVPVLAGATATAAGSPRSAVLADDVATHRRRVGGT